MPEQEPAYKEVADVYAAHPGFLDPNELERYLAIAVRHTDEEGRILSPVGEGLDVWHSMIEAVASAAKRKGVEEMLFQVVVYASAEANRILESIRVAHSVDSV